MVIQADGQSVKSATVKCKVFRHGWSIIMTSVGDCWAETESSGADEGLVAVLGDIGESVSPIDDHETNHIDQTQLALFKSAE